VAADAAEILVTAVTAGAAAGLKDTATAAVKDAYAALIGAIRRRVGHDQAEKVVALAKDQDAAAQAERHKELAVVLTASGADADLGVMSAARAVLALADPAGTQIGKYTVDAREAKGLQVGDNNTMTLNF
jgi:hypothetical protein